MLRWIEQTAGCLVILLVLLDVFLTVLYARIRPGILSYPLGRVTWRSFRGISRLFPGQDAAILSFCGPAILVLLVVLWAVALTCGTALVIHPMLGTSVRASSGSTPADFGTAMYAGGSSLAIVGSSDFVPQTAAFRMFYLFNSLAGLSVLSLTLTYIMQIYTALLRRNTLGLQLYLSTNQSKDAAELIAGMGPSGQFSICYTDLSALSGSMASIAETHHFYPVLFYFRFKEPYYSVSLSTMIALDAVALLQSGLDDRQFGWLKQSGAVTQLSQAAMLLLTTLENAFVPGGASDQDSPDKETLARWRNRYFAGLRRMQEAGIATVADQQAGAASYIALRTRWAGSIKKLAPTMSYSKEDVDPAANSGM